MAAKMALVSAIPHFMVAVLGVGSKTIWDKKKDRRGKCMRKGKKAEAVLDYIQAARALSVLPKWSTCEVAGIGYRISRKQRINV